MTLMVQTAVAESVQCLKQTTVTAFFKCDLCSGIETVPWICSCSVCLCMAEEDVDFGQTPIKPRGLSIWEGGMHFGGRRLVCTYWPFFKDWDVWSQPCLHHFP